MPRTQLLVCVGGHEYYAAFLNDFAVAAKAAWPGGGTDGVAPPWAILGTVDWHARGWSWPPSSGAQRGAWSNFEKVAALGATGLLGVLKSCSVQPQWSET